MTTPYNFTPRIPVPPNPTPLSVTTYVPNSKAKRPPIHNPYDKFTQPEFDVWIGDITGALKRALGQIEADDESKPFERTQEVSTGNATTWYRPIDLDESEDEAVNNSIAEIKARRALGKGKARDPREGPGLGGADCMKPIEIVSSDEEEEHEVELAIGMKDDDNEEEEEEEEEDYSEQEEDYSWKRGQSSSQQFFLPAKRKKYIQEEEKSEGDDSEEGSEEDDEEEPTTRKSRPTEVIDIVSDDEDEIYDDGQDRGHREEEEERDAEELEEGFESTGEEYSEEEEQVRLGTSHLKFHAARIRNSRDFRHFRYAEEEETKDEPEMVEDDEIEEIQPPEANNVRRSPTGVDCRIEIHDPWVGSRLYAEDSYTGGDVRPLPDTHRDPHQLGDDDSYEIEEVITGNKLDVDEMQIAEQDTSFPAHNEKQERPVDIPDPWVGPQTYAEDFYAGGDVRTHPGQGIDPSLLEDTARDDIGVPSASKIAGLDEQGCGENPIEDEEQLEDGLEHDEEAVIQPPTQYMFDSTARRALPIPANAQFISIDNSDEDQKPTKLRPLEVVEVDEIVMEDTAYMHHPIPPLDSTSPNGVDIPVATWPLPSSSDQQDGISIDHYESLYANIEAVTVQTEEQSKVISTLADWNYPPAFSAIIPASAPGHLSTPSLEESNVDAEESAVQTLDIYPSESVDKESSPRPLVHEGVMTQAEKDLDKALVVDHVTLSIPPVEDSEPQLTSQTLIVDPSFSHTSSNDLVNDAQITNHDEGVMSEEAVQEHKIDVEITSEDVVELVNENPANKSTPPQQSSEDIVGGEIESGDVDTLMRETKIHMVSAVLNPHIAAANAENGIPPSVERIDEQMDTQTQLSASTSSVQIPVLVYHPHHTYDFDQLPTPPPDQCPTAQSPSVANDGPSSSLTSPPRRHKVEIKEVQDEDDVRPQPFSADSVELDLRIDVEPGYTVVEPELGDECTDEDVDGEIKFKVEVLSMGNALLRWDEAQSKDGEMQLPMDYVDEEPSTGGRLNEEAEDRAQSPGVVSVELEESKAHHTNCKTVAMRGVPFSTDEEPKAISQVETNIQPQTSSDPGLREPTGISGPPTSATHVTPDSISCTVEHNVPMPVAADANVVDPTSCPDTPSHPSVSLIVTALDEQPQTQRQAPGDGLFTPADESTTVTPAGLHENMHSQILDELARAFFGTPIVSSTPVEELVPVSNADLLSDIGLVIDRAVEQIGVPQSVQLPSMDAEATHSSGAYVSSGVHATTRRDDPISVPISPPLRDPPVSMHVTLTRKPTDPILVSDPYPYSLSTPGVSLMDPTEEDTEQENSMSSNSTLEKDVEDKDTNSILDDADELELQYPPEPNILVELNVSATAKGEGASKIVDGDADGDFDPEFAATRLPQPSVEIQLVAEPPKLIMSDITVAPGPFNGVGKNDVSPRQILSINTAKGISSDDFCTAEATNHNLPEASTTLPNEIVGTFTSTRASKRKRDSLQSPFDKVTEATTERVEKGNNKRISKLVGKGKAKATNPEVVDQTTSEATIHVKPRRKTQSVESVVSRALSKNPSEAWSSSRSSSSASATYRMLRPTSRSSSVASSAPSDQSVAVLPSPTVQKPNVPPVQTLPQLISLFHAHGQKRNNQNHQPQPSQARTHTAQPSRPPIQRVVSLPRVNDVGSTAATSPTVATSPTTATSPTIAASPTTAIFPSAVTSPTLATSSAYTKAVPSPALGHAPAISLSSPVTRSHCRYRRISLPKEEGGPRVCFLVPGCSLNDRELMAAEEIEDHGDATHEESLRMIKDIQSLDFDSYLIGIMRQLVGLDILREQEVFYLPQPGEEVVRKSSPRKERSGLFRGADSSSYTGSPGYSGSIRSPASMKAPASVADSTSTCLSAFRRRQDSEKGSVSAFSDTELEPSDGELPDAKRAKPSPPDEQGGAGPMGPPLKSQGKRKLKGRPSKQIDAEYQPEEAHEGNSDDVQSRNGRKPSKQGVKRRRGTEIMAKDDDEERLLKKIKVRINAPMSQSSAAGDSTR